MFPARDLREVTVHSTPNAVEANEQLGFHAEGREQNMRGIRFIPMRLYLGKTDDG